MAHGIVTFVTSLAVLSVLRREGGPVEGFVLVAVSTGSSGSLRVQVWRKLRSLGAVYVQQSVCLLPARDRVLKEVRRLAGKVRAEGGTARVISVQLPDPAEYADLVAEFNAARDIEYAEVVERTPAFLAEIVMETERGRATYAEVEESEADLDRFRAWLDKIAARDYFTAPGASAARDAVAACEQALAAFEHAALDAETGTPQPDADTQTAASARWGLRLVLPARQEDSA